MREIRCPHCKGEGALTVPETAEEFGKLVDDFGNAMKRALEALGRPSAEGDQKPGANS